MPVTCPLPHPYHCLQLGADPNTQGEFKRTALWRASFLGHEHVIGLLLEGGADLRIGEHGILRAFVTLGVHAHALRHGGAHACALHSTAACVHAVS